MPLRQILSILIVGSFVTSSYMLAFSYIVLLGPNAGVMNHFLMSLFRLENPPFNIYGFGGFVFVATLEGTPLVYSTVISAFKTVDGNLEYSARILGASTLRIILTITLPLVVPAIGAGALIVFISTLSLYGAPAILGVRVVPTEIQALLGDIRFDLAAGVSLYLAALALVGLVFYQRLLRRSERFVTVSGKGVPLETIRLGPWRWPVCMLACTYTLISLFLPYAVLGYASVSHAVSAIPSFENFTLANYAFVFKDPFSIRGLKNSSALSVGAAVIAAMLASIISLMEVRLSDKRFMRVIDAVLMLPFGIPGIVIAVGLILAFIRPPFVLYNTIWIIGIAFVIKYLPIAIRTIGAVFQQIDKSLEEASRIVGASSTTTFSRISVPLAWNGIVSAMVLVFILCFSELGATILLVSPNNETISFAMITAWSSTSFEVTCAIGVIMLAVTLAAVTVTQLALVKSK
jgi:iron(III) transport system permease protein